MKGKILDFSVAQGGGLILSSDGTRYLFNADQWHGQSLPKAGQDVDFNIDDTHKAIDIYPDVYAMPAQSQTVAKLDEIGNKVGDSFNKFATDINNSLVKINSKETPATFVDYAVQTITKNYANFNGRARRKEYWGTMLVYMIVAVILSMLMNITFWISEYLSYFFVLVASIFYLATIVPIIALTVRRLHDVDKSGWWYFISLVPLIGGIWLLILLCTEGTRGENQFGADPKMLEQ
ncbi:DUF805 domain-containing protein [uncultured Moraxella sp.]|uniref:DUF805 domain-containing protein n=1 Tax=uncultured Moraxella sp. TaxID=263769 RepID=UPI0025D056B3|nr:DUF805 domain-containing protein [uncultured Moraxella sp.]